MLRHGVPHTSQLSRVSPRTRLYHTLSRLSTRPPDEVVLPGIPAVVLASESATIFENDKQFLCSKEDGALSSLGNPTG
jgi:hypothetical protein